MQKLTRKFFQLIFKNICSALYQTIAAANASTPVLSPVEMQMAKKLSTPKTQFIFSTVQHFDRYKYTAFKTFRGGYLIQAFSEHFGRKSTTASRTD